MSDIFSIIKNGKLCEYAINDNNINMIFINKKEPKYHGMTPFLFACVYGTPEDLKLLVKHGAKTDFRLIRPSDEHIYKDPKTIIDTPKFYIDCQPEAKEHKSGLNAVALSIMKDNLENLKYLRDELKFDLNERSNGYHPIHIAARQNAINCFNYIMTKQNINIENTKTDDGLTIKDLADKNNSFNIQMKFGKHKINPAPQDETHKQKYIEALQNYCNGIVSEPVYRFIPQLPFAVLKDYCHKIKQLEQYRHKTAPQDPTWKNLICQNINRAISMDYNIKSR